MKLVSRLKNVSGRLQLHRPGMRFTPRFKTPEELLRALKQITSENVHPSFPESTTEKPLPLESIQFEVRGFKLQETHFTHHLAFSMHGLNFEMYAEPSYVLEIELAGVMEIKDFFSLL